MKIGIISDTHITKDTHRFLDLLDTCLKEVDMIIHAGDFVSPELIRELQNYKRFIGV